MNFFSPDLTLILSVLAFLTAGYCLWQGRSLAKLRRTFFLGKNGNDLESVILRLEEKINAGQRATEALENQLTGLRRGSGFSLQQMGLVRFNPFGDGGGNFSFSLALLDAHSSGIIITSLYGREQNRVYSKKIENGKCESKLTGEEEQAISEANTKFQISNANH